MHKMLAIGFSAGGIPLVQEMLQALPADYPLPVVLVTHLPPDMDDGLIDLFGQSAALPVTFAYDKVVIQPGRVYLAPPDYHLLVERNEHFALSMDPPFKSVRPSIDVFLHSAAEAFENRLIAVVLSGANSDGALGMSKVKELGGVTIVLDPLQAKFQTMPLAVIDAVDVDYVVSLEEIISLLLAVQDHAPSHRVIVHD